MLTGIVDNAKIDSFSRVIAALVDAAVSVNGLLQELKEATDGGIRACLTLQVNRNRHFLGELGAFLDGLGTADDEPEDLDGEDEEETPAPRTPAAAAMTAYMRNLRSQARARFTRRALGRTTRAGRIAEWIGNRTLADRELNEIGEGLQTQAALRRFTSPVRRYINGIGARYRRYRRVRQSEKRWYVGDTIGISDVAPLEVDLMLLCVMRAASSLLRDRTIRRNIDDPAYVLLKAYMGLVRNQITVDEATDFSPIQLACMGALSSPGIESFFAAATSTSESPPG